METKQVRAGRDTILGYVERASPVDILAELIWNALDAEAMNVETTVAIGGLDGPEEIMVRDDGHGMPHDQVSDLFLTHGESWKRTGRFSPNINRPLHGQLGRGRFLAYGIAERVEWRSVSADGDTFSETVIHGNRSAPNEFTFDGPWPTSGPSGTTVRMEARQTSRVASLVDGEIQLPLTARLAASLLALPEVKVHYRGHQDTPPDQVSNGSTQSRSTATSCGTGGGDTTTPSRAAVVRSTHRRTISPAGTSAHSDTFICGAMPAKGEGTPRSRTPRSAEVTLQTKQRREVRRGILRRTVD